MRWGRRSDASLRARLQVLESRQRRAVVAIDEMQELLSTAALDLLSIVDLAEIMGRLQAIRTLLSEEGRP
jgi:hypothetical protein